MTTFQNQGGAGPAFAELIVTPLGPALLCLCVRAGPDISRSVVLKRGTALALAAAITAAFPERRKTERRKA